MFNKNERKFGGGSFVDCKRGVFCSSQSPNTRPATVICRSLIARATWQSQHWLMKPGWKIPSSGQTIKISPLKPKGKKIDKGYKLSEESLNFVPRESLHTLYSPKKRNTVDSLVDAMLWDQHQASATRPRQIQKPKAFRSSAKASWWGRGEVTKWEPTKIWSQK